MKKLVVITSVLLTLGLVLYFSVYESVIFFILTGHISLLSITVPPLVMLAFWILIAPVTFIIYKISGAAIWSAIETIGKTHQRRINQRLRLPNPVKSATSLMAITLLDIAQGLPESSASKPELYFRRRFLALPS